MTERRLVSTVLVGLLLLSLGFLAARSLAWARGNAIAKSSDLMLRWHEAARFVARKDPYALPSMTYPPTAAPVFAPLVAPFGQAEVKAAWLVLNGLMLASVIGLVVGLWGRDWPIWLRVAFGLAVAASKPVRLGIGMGQFHLVPVALMLAALAALRGKRPVLAGVLVGIALAKPTMVVPFLAYMAIRRHFAAVAVALGTQAALLIGASAWLRTSPTTLIRSWLVTARSQLDEGLIDVPSLLGPIAPLSATWISLAMLVLSVVALHVFRRAAELPLVALSFFLAAIFTYHRPYDLVLLVPTLAYFLDRAWRVRGADAAAWATFAATFAAMLIVPNDPLVKAGFGDWYDLGFVALSYVALTVLVGSLLASREDAPHPSGPVSE